MKGDVGLPDLGLSREDRNLLFEKVNIVFHTAATVRFNEPLHVAVNVNTKGTDRIIELWNELKHPISFVHVSTAFSNANLHEIGEKVYTTSLKPSEVIDMCDKFDKTSMDQIEKGILETYPNTYTFSKNLAEQVVTSKCKDLPVAIVWSSIVGASLKEPCPALPGILLLVNKGCATAIRARRDARLDLVPVAVFTTHEWTFQRDNCSDLARKVKMLNDSDMVKLNLRDKNWEKYIEVYLTEIKKFILKQEFQSTARQRLARLYWIHQITKMSGIIILLWIILCFVY